MNCNWSPLVLARVSLAALVTALFLLACGGESAPPAPPAPPPFQPQSVVVQLGTKGGATTLISTQAGGWTRNGQPFTSGSTITGENAQSYTLTLVNGAWTAEFVSPDPVPLALGSSGDAVSLQLQEDGTFKLGDETLTSGTVVKANNDNQYKLLLGSDGNWTAEFEPPDPQPVTLGTSGQMLQIDQLEDGSFTLNDQPLATGAVETALNGNKYTLTLGADDTWSATYLQPAPQPLQLGTTGDVLLVYRQENGTYLLDGEQLLGGRVVTASNGQSYRLSLRTGQDGMVSWVANYQTSTVSVTLGASGGRVSLTRLENGKWMRGTNEFSSGDTVTGVNGFEYRLTLGADGTWIVESLPATINVTVIGADTTLQLARHEDGSFRYDNTTVASGDEIEAGGNTYRLRYTNRRWTATFLQGEVVVPLGAGSDTITLIKKADGTYELNGTRVRNASVVRSPNTGIRYRLSLSNGVWSSSVYIPPTTDPGDGGGGGTDPVVAVESIIDALPSSFFTSGNFDPSLNMIQAGISDATDSNGVKIDYSPYGGSGRYEDDTFVESALRAINKILGPIENQGLADGDDSQQFVARVLVDAHWTEVRTALDDIFAAGNGEPLLSTNPPQRSGETDLDEALDDLEDLRDDLADAASFKSAFKTRIDTAVVNDAAVTGDKIFNARKRVLALGSSSNTRFGVISTLGSGATAEAVAGVSGSYTKGAFAFSPLPATKVPNQSSIPSILPSRGTARYSGRTWAIDANEVLYSGAIELLASIGIEKVEAKISNLRRSDNNAIWKYQNKEVDKIELPEITEAELDESNDSFSKTADAKVFEVGFGGGLFFTPASTEFKGQFVGSSSGQSTVTAVIGTWNLRDGVLEGSYGAERVGTNPVPFPASSTDVVEEYDPGGSVTFDTANKTVTVDTFTEGDAFSLTTLNSTTKSKNDLTATVRLRSTSFARFGVWRLVDSKGTSDITDDTTTTGFFGYSPLGRAQYTGNGDPKYPRRVDATYTGSTVAIDKSGNLYDGSYTLSVDWNSDSLGGTIWAAVSSLRTVSGSNRFKIGNSEVSQIGFTHSTIGNLSSSSGEHFNSDLTTTVQYTNGLTEPVTGGTRTHKGFFVGNTGVGNTGIDGPFGVIGVWSLKPNSDDQIEGSFGATLVRAP